MSLAKTKMIFLSSSSVIVHFFWIFHSRKINNNMNHLHERCLRVIFNDKNSSFKELLERNGSVPIHNSNLQILVTEMFKVYTIIVPQIFTEIFSKPNLNYELRHTSHFSVLHVRSIMNGTKNLLFLGHKIWDIVPTRLKEMTTLKAFKSGIKNLWPQNCPYRLYKCF